MAFFFGKICSCKNIGCVFILAGLMLISPGNRFGISPGVNHAHAKTLSHLTNFTVYFVGIPVATATFKLGLNGKNYTISMSGKAIGLTKLLANGVGTIRASGNIRGRRVNAASQHLTYKDKKKKITTVLKFKSGSVVFEKYTPKPKEHSDTIPVYESDKIGVIDPASGIIVPVKRENIGNGRKVCNRGISIYDGASRYDTNLYYKRDETIKVDGFSGKAIVCKVRWVPISGHRPKKDIKFMAANEGIEISFAQVGTSAVYMPIRIKIPTKYGTILAKASKFKVQ